MTHVGSQGFQLRSLIPEWVLHSKHYSREVKASVIGICTVTDVKSKGSLQKKYATGVAEQDSSKSKHLERQIHFYLQYVSYGAISYAYSSLLRFLQHKANISALEDSLLPPSKFFLVT